MNGARKVFAGILVAFTIQFGGGCSAWAMTPFSLTAKNADLSKLNAVKDCLDFTFCRLTTTHLTQLGNEYIYELRTTAESGAELDNAINRCVFETMDTQIKIVDLSTHLEVTRHMVAGHRPDFEQMHPNLYAPDFTEAQKNQHYQHVKMLLAENKYQEALEYDVKILGLQTYGYTIHPDPKMKDYMITDHSKKDIAVGTAFFEEPCDLLRGVRHEFEHVYQAARTRECIAEGGIVSLNDHNYRERSAHLDDLANLDRMCPIQADLARQRASITKRALTQYFSKDPTAIPNRPDL